MYLRTILWSALLLFSFVLHSDEGKDEETKYFLSVAAIFKDEAPYFKEWLEYHRVVGVDHFYLYNNGSSDNFLEVLSPYIHMGIVTLIDWPDKEVSSSYKNEVYAWVACTQVPAYYDACQRSVTETEWLAMIDLDEFMVPVEFSTMKKLLAQYEEVPGVMLFWKMYGTSHVSSLEKNRLLIEALHLTIDPSHELNTKVKSIVRPALFDRFYFPPHICIYKQGLKPTYIAKEKGRLHHYFNRTIDYFLLEKVSKKEHMDNRTLSSLEIEQSMNMGNDQEDTENGIVKYIPELRKRMGYDK